MPFELSAIPHIIGPIETNLARFKRVYPSVPSHIQQLTQQKWLEVLDKLDA